MDDFTKIKLINSLIDAVEHFYDGSVSKSRDQKYLKGFCEGVAFSLTQLEILNAQSAKEILQGRGQKLSYLLAPQLPENEPKHEIASEAESQEKPINDAPLETISKEELALEASAWDETPARFDEMDAEEEMIGFDEVDDRVSENLEIPTIFRKKKRLSPDGSFV